MSGSATFGARLAATLLACLGSSALHAQDPSDPAAPDPTAATADPNGLSAADVQTVVQAAAAAVSPKTLVIAVVDRQGNILGLYRKPQAPATSKGNYGSAVDTNELAVATARTGAFFSHNQAPLSSRTVRFISQIHYPPGISYTASGDLYGIENTNRGCSFNTTFLPGVNYPYARSVDGTSNGLGIQTGKADMVDSDPSAVNPGGLPLYKNGIMVGGIGVVGDSPDVNEYAAVVGSIGSGFGPTAQNLQPPGVVFVGGIALPFVNQTTLPSGVSGGAFEGGWVVAPKSSPAPAPEGNFIQMQAGSALSLADVQGIVQHAIDAANATRAAIRLPLGSRTRMAIAVGDVDGTLLALYRMTDSTMFSVDVAVAKSRNVVYFSGNPVGDLPGVPAGTAFNNRPISFGAQPLYPPGIDGSGKGPFFDLLVRDTANPCTQGSQAANPNQSGVVFFPGALALYRDGQIVGGLGISGDGVDQDDYVASQGAQGFEAPTNIRSDQVFVNGVRLPYSKFPRNPTD